MKLQDPKTKLQRTSNRQRLKDDRALTYSLPTESHWTGDEGPAGGKRHAFDLEERTAVFGESVIVLLKRVPRSPNNDRLIDQLTGCGTSIGANYCEANEGLSKKDFHNIIGRCRKEAKETKFFLRMIATAEPTLAEDARSLYREAKELHLIFCAMYRKSAP